MSKHFRTVASIRLRAVYFLRAISFHCAAFLLALTLPTSANAQDETEFLIRCDKGQQQLTIAKPAFMPKADAEARKQIREYAVDPQSLTRLGGTEAHPLILPVGKKDYICQLGKTSYRVLVEPGIHNSNPHGRCGGAEPTISVSLWRDGVALFSKRYLEECHRDREIYRVQVQEPGRSIRFLVRFDGFYPLAVERVLVQSSMPKDWDNAVFSHDASGDKDVDIFLAVFRREPEEVKALLKRGANPNATDARGMPPLSWLANGREEAMRTKTLEAFDRESEDMAKALFAAGASGRKPTASADGTLLETLIGRVPQSVIDLLFEHGADAREGTPLNRAANLADVRLLQLLIEKGADASKKDTFGTAPLSRAVESVMHRRPQPGHGSVEDSVACIRLLFAHGATVRDSTKEVEPISNLVKTFGKNEALKIALAELIPRTDRGSIEAASVLAQKLANSNGEYVAISHWLKAQLARLANA